MAWRPPGRTSSQVDATAEKESGVATHEYGRRHERWNDGLRTFAPRPMVCSWVEETESPACESRGENPMPTRKRTDRPAGPEKRTKLAK